jgi:hypothetical protein
LKSDTIFYIKDIFSRHVVVERWAAVVVEVRFIMRHWYRSSVPNDTEQRHDMKLTFAEAVKERMEGGRISIDK